MRKQGAKFKTKIRSVPMILHREGEMLQLEVRQEMAAILTSKLGIMQPQHFDKLAQISDIAKVAGARKPGSTSHFQPELEFILSSILCRYYEHKKIGVNAKERQRIPILLALNDAYWKGQTTTFYNSCGAVVNATYKEGGMFQPLDKAKAA